MTANIVPEIGVHLSCKGRLGVHTSEGSTSGELSALTHSAAPLASGDIRHSLVGLGD